MNKTFDISEVKDKPGIFGGILPRGCGKTTAILKAMKPGDYYLSSKYVYDIVFDFYKNSITENTRYKITTYDNKHFSFYERPPSRLFRGHLINTLFIDEFLLYSVDRIEYILYNIFPATKNIILISSPHYFDILPCITLKLRNSNRTAPDYFIRIYYYEKIRAGKKNVVSLPDRLFEL